MDSDEFRNLKTNEQKEEWLIKYIQKFIDNSNYKTILEVLINAQNNWKDLTIARLTKIIKIVFESISIRLENFENVLFLLNGLIDFASEKKMLKLDLECKLIQVFLTVGRFRDCLDKISDVLKELKKFDDKINMISLYVIESRAHYELHDFDRARSSLTSARATAVSSACPSYLQAQIDLLNGMYLCDEQLFETSTSYFIEAMENFYQSKQVENSQIALQYILISKILASKHDEIQPFLSLKPANLLKDNEKINILCRISKICLERDLRAYNDVLMQNNSIIDTDRFMSSHLNSLYNLLLDNNIQKIIEPYSHIKIRFIAEKLCLSENMIENKLRNMILEDKLHGTLDHLSQCLVIKENKKFFQKEAVENISILNSFFE